MKVAGIIAEYNPFHRGHAYQIEETRKKTGADVIVAVISGSFVQRGAPALFDAHARARLALLGGADLVFALPAANACQSAEFFARAGVKLLDGLGCVDVLSFGSECGDIRALEELARILLDEPEDYRETLKIRLRAGEPFPAARQQALAAYLSREGENPQDAALLLSPNNILGVEYLKALRRLRSSIKPFTIFRKGSGYHDTGLEGTFPSASAIRLALKENGGGLPAETERLFAGMPSPVGEAFADALNREGCLWEDDFSQILRWMLYSRSRQEMTSIRELSPELADRIGRLRNSFETVSQFTALLKTRELTYSRISRALFHLLLDIRQAPPISYARLLGFRREASGVLRAIKENGKIPLITGTANAALLLDEQAHRLLEEEITICHLYETIRCSRYHRPFRHEHTRQLTIL